MSLSKRDRFRILSRDGFTCRYCGRAAPVVELAVDHRFPRSLGGSDDESNLVAACVACNLGKGARLLPVMIPRERANFTTQFLALAWIVDLLTELGDGSEREWGIADSWYDHLHEVPPLVLGRLIRKTREWCLSTPCPRAPASDHIGAAVERYLETGEE